ncbi:hypothetical protein [Geobacillus stearothermophilus]|uniref:hypothetical protein n=1 Tax=Geobacillus stearothermophilus TaxID=1422 RepID=UPI00066FB345|nr:hypothetical protein [Geobacillus stearothermophilus]KMY63330.1 hypothetical protein AA904_03745 [Geobacillus stearothermophilus]KMY64621.1 hypothetical protein AA905_02455 [Geobacillus stearothermophilus]
MKKLQKIFRDYAEDFFIFIGLTLINVATFRLSVTAGLYILGFSCLAVGIFAALHPPKRYPP